MHQVRVKQHDSTGADSQLEAIETDNLGLRYLVLQVVLRIAFRLGVEAEVFREVGPISSVTSRQDRHGPVAGPLLSEYRNPEVHEIASLGIPVLLDMPGIKTDLPFRQIHKEGRTADLKN